jgi:hypothetical protein
MKDIDTNLAEHHHDRHFGNLEIGNDEQMRRNRAEQIQPPVAGRREEQARQKDGCGGPDGGDTGGWESQQNSDNAPGVVAGHDEKEGAPVDIGPMSEKPMPGQSAVARPRDDRNHRYVPQSPCHLESF